jgi:hypothetical protein
VTLPVDPERLRTRFPDLDDGDLAAYVEVTQRVLANPARKGRLMAEILAEGRLARGKARETLTAEESLAVRYLTAVEKMQD